MKKNLLLVTLFFTVLQLHAAILHVPTEYGSIQGAVDGALSGDTILLANGTYTENVTISGKSLTISSQFMLTQQEADIDATVWLSAADQFSPKNTIYVSGSRTYILSLSGITFKNNPKSAMYFSGYNFKASHLKFENNTGGALDIWDGDATIKHTLFESNSKGNNGGAVDINLSNEDRTVLIDSCQFLNNTSSSYGGALRASINMSYFSVSNSVFKGNTAFRGGAMCIYPGTNAYVYVQNNVVADNTAQKEGAGLYINGRTARINSNTIVNNHLTTHGADYKGAGIFLQGTASYSYTFFNNNIIRYNAIEETDKEVYLNYQSAGNTLVFAYSNLSADVDEYYTANANVVVSFGDGNITSEPLFLDLQQGDYSLQPTSPCIDAANPDTNGDNETFRYDEEDRDPDGTRKDIGAIYYHQDIQGALMANFGHLPVGIYAPLMVEFSDSTDWLVTNPPTTWAWDFDNDGVIDSNEQNPTHIFATSGVYTVTLTVGNGEIENTIVKPALIVVSPSEQTMENIDIRFSGEQYDMGNASWEEQGVPIEVVSEFETSSGIYDGELRLHPARAIFDFTSLEGRIYSVSIRTADWCPPAGCTFVRFYKNSQVIQEYSVKKSSTYYTFTYAELQGLSIDSLVINSNEGAVQYVLIQKEKIEDPCPLAAEINIERIDCTHFGVSAQITNNQKPYTEQWFVNDEPQEVSEPLELTEAGVYAIKLVVTDELDGTCSVTKEAEIEVLATPTITINPTVDKATKKVTLYGIVEGIEGFTYAWDFGDNSEINTIDLLALEHIYAANGTYTITLSVMPANTPQCVYSKEFTATFDNCYLQGDIFEYQISCNEYSISSYVENNNQPYTEQWYIDGVPFSDVNQAPQVYSAGAHQIRLEVMDEADETCSLSFMKELNVYEPTITVNTVVNPQTLEVTYNAVIEGMDEYDFYWYFGDNGNGTGADPVLSGTYMYSLPGNYTIDLSVMPKGGMGGCSYYKSVDVVIPVIEPDAPCDKGAITGAINADVAMLIAGAVSVDAYKKEEGDVYAFLSNATISQTGEFSFDDLAVGEYILVGKIANPEQYPAVVVTYFNQMMNQVFSWQEASPIDLRCNSTAHVELSMITLDDLLTGNASVSGYVYYSGGTRNVVLSSVGGKRTSALAAGMKVYLYNTDTNQLVAQTTTDTNGYYFFANVPVGTYKVMVEIPGVPLQDAQTVQITRDDESIVDMDYMITPLGIVPIETAWLIIDVVGEGSVKVNNVSYTVSVPLAKDAQIELTAMPTDGYTFVGWSGDLVSTNTTETITMSADKTIIATFDNASGVMDKTSSDYKVYPSPFTHELIVSSSHAMDRIMLTNVVGKVVYNSLVEMDNVSISTTHLPSGVYCLSVIKDGEVQFVQKVIKQ